MHLFSILAFLTLNRYVSYVRGYEQPQAPLLSVEPQSDLVSTIINFDELYTNFGTGLGASNSFTYNNLTFKSFLVASIPITLTRPYQPWDVNEVFCLGSAPNVIVGSRSNSSNLWPTISACSLSEDFAENKCNGTFNVVSFRIRPMGKLLGQIDGVRLTVLILDFLRLSEVDTQGSRETLLRATIPNNPEFEPESDSGPGFDPPPKPGFPPFDNTKTAYQLLVGYLHPGPALPSKVHRKYFRPGFGTKVDTIQIYGYTYPMPGSDVESVDWPFCIDDLELEFNPDEEDKGTSERTDVMGDKRRHVGWREQIYV